MRAKFLFAVVALALVGGGAFVWLRGSPDPPPATSATADRGCASCHPKAVAQWRDSEHAQQMAAPSAAYVKGDFERDNVYAFEGTRSRMFREGDAWRMELTGPDGQRDEARAVFDALVADGFTDAAVLKGQRAASTAP